jgi:GTP-binding protein
MFLNSSFYCSYGDYQDIPNETTLELAFIGRSNSGKSSLINAICLKKKIAKISKTPGKTQLINFFNLGSNCFLVDLPGYGFAKVSKSKTKSFSSLISSYLIERKQLRLVFLILDSRLGITKLDELMIKMLVRIGLRFVIILNKIDKLNQMEFQKSKKKIRDDLSNICNFDVYYFYFSAKTGKGSAEIKNYLVETENLPLEIFSKD